MFSANQKEGNANLSLIHLLLLPLMSLFSQFCAVSPNDAFLLEARVHF